MQILRQKLQSILVKYLIKYDFSKTYIDTINYTNEIEVLNINNNIFLDSDYVFILGFNQGEIPTIIKDEDYFNNKEKVLLNLDTIEELNKNNYNNWIRLINSIKNLTITAKKNNERGECYISSLNDTLNLKEEVLENIMIIMKKREKKIQHL